MLHDEDAEMIPFRVPRERDATWSPWTQTRIPLSSGTATWKQ
jgi:hypothetical protein